MTREIHWSCELCLYDQNPQSATCCDMCGLMEDQDITIAYHNRALNVKDKETAQ